MQGLLLCVCCNARLGFGMALIMLCDDEPEVKVVLVKVRQLPCSHLPQCQFGQQSLNLHEAVTAVHA